MYFSYLNPDSPPLYYVYVTYTSEIDIFRIELELGITPDTLHSSIC